MTIASLDLRAGAPLALGDAAAPGPVVGLEHEFRVFQLRRRLDFRRVVEDRVGRSTIDPGDQHARRRPWGGVITADGREAEIAIPPVRLAGGFTRTVLALAEAGRDDLRSALRWHGVEGYSTHFSVSAPAALVERASRTFTARFGPALMLLTDRRTSPGLLVRPRPGRVELGTEYVGGEHLRAAMALAAGGVLASIATPAVDLPPAVATTLLPDTHRYGWFVGRRSFGADLYEDGRDTRLRLVDGGQIRAGRLLEAAWASARSALAGLAASDELLIGDRIVAGDLALPLEDPRAIAGAHAPVAPIRSLPEGNLLQPRRRPAFEVRAVVARWEYTVFELRSPGRRAGYAAVPRAALGAFLEQLDAGTLDHRILAFLAAPAAGRVLRSFAQTSEPALWDGLVLSSELAPVERAALVTPGLTVPLTDPDRPGKTPGGDDDDDDDWWGCLSDCRTRAIALAVLIAIALIIAWKLVVPGGGQNVPPLPTPSPFVAPTTVPTAPVTVPTPTPGATAITLNGGRPYQGIATFRNPTGGCPGMPQTATSPMTVAVLGGHLALGFQRWGGFMDGTVSPDGRFSASTKQVAQSAEGTISGTTISGSFTQTGNGCPATYQFTGQLQP